MDFVGFQFYTVSSAHWGIDTIREVCSVLVERFAFPSLSTLVSGISVHAVAIRLDHCRPSQPYHPLVFACIEI